MLKVDWNTTHVSLMHPCGEPGCKRNAKPYHALCDEHFQQFIDKLFKISRYKAI
jgi:hypothetical protein